eukprot:TRINITY_DN4923_c0_g1_i1.p2 TRINITY_DN4923_c0_g1~~TRINITY_DN4923_c0_g1_i1.p2  ORF type:complete len:122 (-),score=16.14 TRINITY_DN4923_c0_g1_i1:262-627(-)
MSQVTEDDQNNINSFSRLNTRKHELETNIKEKQGYIEELEDASNELILADDDEEDLRLLIGECFVHTDNDSVEERLTKDKELAESEVQKFQDELQKIEGQMNKLKEQLYSKFGDKINLEEQ